MSDVQHDDIQEGSEEEGEKGGGERQTKDGPVKLKVVLASDAQRGEADALFEIEGGDNQFVSSVLFGELLRRFSGPFGPVASWAEAFEHHESFKPGLEKYWEDYRFFRTQDSEDKSLHEAGGSGADEGGGSDDMEEEKEDADDNLDYNDGEKEVGFDGSYGAQEEGEVEARKRKKRKAEREKDVVLDNLQKLCRTEDAPVKFVEDSDILKIDSSSIEALCDAAKETKAPQRIFVQSTGEHNFVSLLNADPPFWSAFKQNSPAQGDYVVFLTPDSATPKAEVILMGQVLKYESNPGVKKELRAVWKNGKSETKTKKPEVYYLCRARRVSLSKSLLKENLGVNDNFQGGRYSHLKVRGKVYPASREKIFRLVKHLVDFVEETDGSDGNDVNYSAPLSHKGPVRVGAGVDHKDGEDDDGEGSTASSRGQNLEALKKDTTFGQMATDKDGSRVIYVFGLTEVSYRTLVPVEQLSQWAYQLIEGAASGRQLLFTGPSGTGKTWSARILSECLLRMDCPCGCFYSLDRCKTDMEGCSHMGCCRKRIDQIQLSETYSYAQFMGGARVGSDGKVCNLPGALYKLLFWEDGFDVAGLLPQEKFQGAKTCMVVDEINRGKTSSIFGETLQLLEYRGARKAVTTAPGFTFYVPDAFFLIGTMNTEDKSLFPMDRALMERFHFYDMLDASVGSSSWPSWRKVDGPKPNNPWPTHPPWASIIEIEKGTAAANTVPTLESALGDERARRAQRCALLIERAWRLRVRPEDAPKRNITFCQSGLIFFHEDQAIGSFLNALMHVNWFLVAKFDRRKEIEIGHARFLSVFETSDWKAKFKNYLARKDGVDIEALVLLFKQRAFEVVQGKMAAILDAFYPRESDLGRVAQLLKLLTDQLEGVARPGLFQYPPPLSSLPNDGASVSPSPSESTCGLYNLGQTCWMNTILQMLFHDAEFRRHLEIPPDSILTSALRSLFREMQNSRGRPVYPTEFLRLLQRTPLLSSFVAERQHDASEFIEKFISLPNLPSGLTQLFEFTTLTDFKCPQGHQWSGYDVQTILKLPLSGSTLQHLFTAYGQSERRDVQCEKCFAKDATATIKFKTTPDHLIIRLGRDKFSTFTKMSWKDNREIDFNELEMLGGVHYRLMAVVKHDGPTLHSGHYTCQVRVHGHWYYFSDADRPKPCASFSCKDAFILLFHREDQEDAGNSAAERERVSPDAQAKSGSGEDAEGSPDANKRQKPNSLSPEPDGPPQSKKHVVVEDSLNVGSPFSPSRHGAAEPLRKKHASEGDASTPKVTVPSSSNSTPSAETIASQIFQSF